jgi:hypothetical protein
MGPPTPEEDVGEGVAEHQAADIGVSMKAKKRARRVLTDPRFVHGHGHGRR